MATVTGAVTPASILNRPPLFTLNALAKKTFSLVKFPFTFTTPSPITGPVTRVSKDVASVAAPETTPALTEDAVIETGTI